MKNCNCQFRPANSNGQIDRLPFRASTFEYTFTRMLWSITFRITHTMIKHAPGTFHSSYLLQTILKTIWRIFACTASIEFFREKFLAVSAIGKGTAETELEPMVQVELCSLLLLLLDLIQLTCISDEP